MHLQANHRLVVAMLAIAACAHADRAATPRQVAAEATPVERPASPVHQHPAVAYPEDEALGEPSSTVLASRNTAGEAAADAARRPQAAIAVLAPTRGSKVRGTVHFVERGDGLVVTADVTGLRRGRYAVHVHAFGDCSASDAASAGEPISGDLASARDRVDTSLGGMSSILGRAVIVVAGTRRVACGVIGAQRPEEESR